MTTAANRVALITGAGSGIGRQLALTLAAEGNAIAAVDLKPESLQTLEAELSGKSLAWTVADVTDRDALNAAVAKLSERLGPVDLLIASAGVGMETSALDFRASDFETVVRVNLIGVANSIAAVLPGMIARNSGHLVAISSMASCRGLPLMAGYCASKSGVNALMDALRVELRSTRVATTIICPGWVRTPMTANIPFTVDCMLSVEDAARRIVDAIRRRKAFFAFPPSDARRGRLLRLLPRFLSDWLVARLFRKMKKQ
jgi:short-subunit dehydrogenase